MNSKKLADFLSFVLGPQTWLPIIFILLIYRTDLTIQYPNVLVPLVFILQVLIPLLGPYLAFRQGKITSIDIPERQDRVRFMLVASVSWLASLLLIYLFGNPELFKTSVIIFILILIMSVITSFWKISLHVATNTAGAFFVNYIFGWQHLYLFLLIPIVAWARLKLKVHTPKQVLAGFGVTALVAIIYVLFISQHRGF